MNRRPLRPGFTLIELLAASALAAVLMLVLMQVMASLGRTRAVMRTADENRDAAHTPWKSDLLDLIRRDLANAAEVKFAPDRLTITGHGAIDRRTMQPSHEPVTVVYEIDRGDRFVRRQSPRGGMTGQPVWSELVCTGVSRLSIAPVADSRPNLGMPRPGALSAPIRIRIDGPAGTVVDEIVVIR